MSDQKKQPIKWSVVDESLFETYETAQLGEWTVKVSTYGKDQIMVFMVNLMSIETQLRFFDNERDAVLWMEYMGAKYF